MRRFIAVTRKPTKPRKPRKRIEANRQMRLVKKMNRHGVPYYSIPNEGKRSPIMGALLKRMGMKPGMPDLHIFRPSKGFSGLYIEMKKDDKEKPRLTQLQRHSELREEGHLVVVHWDEKEAWKCICDYFDWNIPWDIWDE